MKVLIIGAGGHGQVVADILQAQHDAGDEVEALGYVDDNPELESAQRLGKPVLGPVAAIPRIEHDGLIVAIGENSLRARLHARIGNHVRFAIARHPSALIARGATVGDGSMICARVVIGCGSRVGRGVILNTACTVDHHAWLDDFVHVAPGVHLGGDVSVGRGTLLGIGAVVLPGISIGAHAVVGAGAVVTRDVADGAMVVGVPAVAIRTVVAGGL